MATQYKFHLPLRPKLFLCFLCFLFIQTFNCVAQSSPNIGDKWKGEIDYSKKIILPIHDLVPMVKLKHEGIHFSMGVQDSIVIFIATRDSGFAIDGETYINKPLSSFKNKSDINKMPEWTYYLPIKNGWYAGFSSKKIEDTSRVTFLFKSETIDRLTGSVVQRLPDIGEEWKGQLDPRAKIKLPPPDDVVPAVNLTCEGIRFMMGVEDSTVIFIATRDKRFTIDGEQYIDKPLSSFNNKGSITKIPVELYSAYGWSYYLPIKDGWYAGFTSSKIGDSSRVSVLFKYSRFTKEPS